MTPDGSEGDSEANLPESILGTIMSFTAHSRDQREMDRMRSVSLEVRKAIDNNLSLFNEKTCVLEILDCPDHTLDGIWFLERNHRQDCRHHPDAYHNVYQFMREGQTLGVLQKLYLRASKDYTTRVRFTGDQPVLEHDVVEHNLAIGHLHDLPKYQRGVGVPKTALGSAHIRRFGGDPPTNAYQVGVWYEMTTPLKPIFTAEEEAKTKQSSMQMGSMLRAMVNEMQQLPAMQPIMNMPIQQMMNMPLADFAAQVPPPEMVSKLTHFEQGILERNALEKRAIQRGREAQRCFRVRVFNSSVYEL